jgi:hypothetical protein
MAKYEDYVKDELEQEIEDAAQGSAERQGDEEATIPERFRGKSAVEIAKSYSELEKLYSKQAQDLGVMRKSVDDLLTLQSQRSAAHGAEAESKKPLTVDDIYENPDQAIRKVVKEESADRIAQLERELQASKIEKAMAAFTESYPTWREDVHDPAMIAWIHEKPYRVRLARAADARDFEAAGQLFGSYYDTKARSNKEEKRQEKKRKVLDASLESAGAGVPETVERYSRSELLEKRIAAKRGDSAAERWLNAHADSIQQAYAEGRVVD